MSTRPRPELRPFAFLALLAALSGCAVLTESQVSEVRRFSKATDDYTELPGSVITAYGELRRDVILLDASRKQLDARTRSGNPDPAAAAAAWERVTTAYEQETEYDQNGKQLDAQLAILDRYADLLGRVVSDEYTDALGESAAQLGSSISDATKAYNQAFRAGQPPISDVGGAIAAGIRAAGGLYIRHRQAAVLRETVRAADPMIQELMDDVTATADLMAESFANQETNALGPTFESVATRSGRLDVVAFERVYDDLARARRGGALAKQVGAAAQTYKLAHARLVEETTKRRDLKVAIEEIQTLRAEIDAAKKVEAKVKK
jgi:hypothetical protein